MASQLRPSVGRDDHTRGPVDAATTLVVYGDYECPYSRKVEQAVAQLVEAGAGSVRAVYRHFPLNRIHPHAALAAEAAEAAAAQGQFWALHELLFTRQDRLAVEDLVGYAAELGLDELRVAEQLHSRTHRQRVRDDTRSGIASGVQATPTVFVNGVKREEPYHAEELFRDVILPPDQRSDA